MQTLSIKDLPDYLNIPLIAREEDEDINTVLLFRGQSSNAPLLPKVVRKDPTVDTAHQERKMMEELRRRGALFIGAHITDDWEALVLAQHFGMATRLLDWTTNPLTALWFACEDLDRRKSAYVYLLIPEDKYLLDRKKDKDPFAITLTKALQPNLNNNRIVAQAGWFTAHAFSSTAKRFVPLQVNTNHSKHLWQIEVPGPLKKKLIMKLDLLGINRQALFPDLQGICEHINWLHGIGK